MGLALEKKIKLADVTKFHQEVWSNLSSESGQRFSPLIAHFAVQNKFAIVAQVKKSTILPT